MLEDAWNACDEIELEVGRGNKYLQRRTLKIVGGVTRASQYLNKHRTTESSLSGLDNVTGELKLIIASIETTTVPT